MFQKNKSRKTSLLRRVILGTAIVCMTAAVAGAQQKELTLDTIFDPQSSVKFNGSLPTGLTWLEDGKHYLEFKRADDGGQLVKVDVATGEETPFYDAAKMQSALAKQPGITADEAKRWSHRDRYNMNPAETAVLLNLANDIFYYQFGSDHVIRLTNNPEPEVGEQFSPDGRTVSFVRDNNLYVVDLESQRERALTTDGTDKILNGRLDWVYQEELYGRGKYQGYWWSPDSNRIAFLRLDETRVPLFTITNDVPFDQEVEITPYPKAGDPNPVVKLGIAEIAGGNIHWADTYRYLPDDLLISRVAWAPNSKTLTFQAQNREQTWLDLNFVNVEGQQFKIAIHETSKTWVEVIDNPHWMDDGTFLWLSERTGYRHIYHYSADGKLVNQVTSGEWEARTIDAIDSANSLVYFSGTERSPIGDDIYRINLDGSGLKRLSAEEGTHRAEFSPTASAFLDTWSDVNTPAKIGLYQSDGNKARVVADNSVSALKEYKLGQVEFIHVKARDGFIMDAQMIKPPDFDPNKKHPVMCYTYSGPHAQSVRNGWGGPRYMWYQMLAEHGYIVWICDNRSASGKGIQSAWPIFHNFGEVELCDLEDGLSWLKSQPYVDAGRIGMWGWSFGGFMTSYALTHSKSFKIGIAGGTVSDWRNYDSIYTERYMGMPQKNPQGYKTSSVRLAAGNLNGKLLLIHGGIDDNVHTANTIQLIYALQRAGKQFNLMLYPKSRHGVTDPVLNEHLMKMMTDFIFQNL
ncbi:MAG TPA: DPP IV N-terminal domain-containing protein [Blastocatellia bacterium]